MAWSFDPDRIRLGRESRGLTQVALAQIIGIDRQMLSRWERGDVLPGQDSLAKVGNALEVPPQFFFVDIVPNVHDEENEKKAA